MKLGLSSLPSSCRVGPNRRYRENCRTAMGQVRRFPLPQSSHSQRLIPHDISDTKEISRMAALFCDKAIRS